MKLTNQKIYTYALAITEAFSDTDIKFPMRINFYFQKNKKILIELAQGIEESRLEIIKNYGTIEDGGNYSIPTNKLEEAQQEMLDLLNLEQEVQIYTISADSLTDDISLTTGQMEAIMFMID